MLLLLARLAKLSSVSTHWIFKDATRYTDPLCAIKPIFFCCYRMLQSYMRPLWRQQRWSFMVSILIILSYSVVLILTATFFIRASLQVGEAPVRVACVKTSAKNKRKNIIKMCVSCSHAGSCWSADTSADPRRAWAAWVQRGGEKTGVMFHTHSA